MARKIYDLKEIDKSLFTVRNTGESILIHSNNVDPTKEPGTSYKESFPIYWYILDYYLLYKKLIYKLSLCKFFF